MLGVPGKNFPHLETPLSVCLWIQLCEDTMTEAVTITWCPWGDKPKEMKMAEQKNRKHHGAWCAPDLTNPRNLSLSLDLLYKILSFTHYLFHIYLSTIFCYLLLKASWLIQAHLKTKKQVSDRFRLQSDLFLSNCRMQKGKPSFRLFTSLSKDSPIKANWKPTINVHRIQLGSDCTLCSELWQYQIT